MRPLTICSIIFLIAALSAAQDATPTATNGDSAPTLISKVDPQYTDEARRAQVQSPVMLRVMVSIDGKAHTLLVARGAGFGLDEKAIEAVRQWQFKPGIRTAIPLLWR